MPDTYTTWLNLTKPEVGSSRDTWGSKTNANWDSLDSYVSMSAPIGMIIDFAGPLPPPGYLVCDGRTVSRVTYSALFGVIGTSWGSGDGSLTFGLPNLKGRASVGTGSMTDANGTVFSVSFAQSLGNASNAIQQAHLPNYAITTDVQGYHGHGGVTANAGGHQHTTDAQGTHSHGGQTSVELQAHTHSGGTDTQGDHSHSLYEVFGSSGGGGGGGFAVSGTSYFGGYTSVNGAHAHNFTTGNENQNHAHTINADGYHAHTALAVGDHAHGLYYDGNHQHTIYLGGLGTLFSIVQPSVGVTKIIYAGSQAVARVTTDAAPASLRDTDEPDELTLIREQLAELRALLAPVGRAPRLMQAPMRGPH